MSTTPGLSPAPAPTTAASLRHVLSHLVMPLLMCVGMGLAYLGAFHNPEPHQLKVAIVGSGPSAQVLAQSLEDKAGGDALDVRTVGSRGEAAGRLKDQAVFGAYVPGGERADGERPGRAEQSGRPELLVASAGSETSATAVEKVFTEVAASRGAPLKVTDVAGTASGDPTGQGLFFLLVAISIGSYASVAVLGAAGGALALWIRALLGLGTGLVVSLIGAVFAGPLFHLVDHDLAGVWAMAWLYSTGILWIGVALHTFLKRWTTLGVMVLFVMLNFTSSGGIFRPELQPGFFGALHAFWNGAGFVEGARSLVYFDGNGLGRYLLTLTLWALAGLVLLAAAWAAETRRRRTAEARAAELRAAAVLAASRVTARGVAAEEEMEEAVAV
ncbi:hypothetical protein [Streptomyces sp. H27-D2]|uniref:hypothetical protein n=1 Tax=Streptomyces sp. H27-D2 TaxID=3046304 RepID=UPI002DBE886B|nr:hypothetical protein [Streptomyces sp. H27-D2]MEC4017395.1 hypothetical protein [Streptomyces sp. H27-D2]